MRAPKFHTQGQNTTMAASATIDDTTIVDNRVDIPLPPTSRDDTLDAPLAAAACDDAALQSTGEKRSNTCNASCGHCSRSQGVYRQLCCVLCNTLLDGGSWRSSTSATRSLGHAAVRALFTSPQSMQRNEAQIGRSANGGCDSTQCPVEYSVPSVAQQETKCVECTL